MLRVFLALGVLLSSIIVTRAITSEPNTKAMTESAAKTEENENTQVEVKMPTKSQEVTILEEIKNQKKDLSDKAAKLEEREKELTVKERALEEEISKLEAIREEIRKEKEAQAKDHEAKVSKLVETFEAMSPKAASGIFAGLNDRLAVDVASKLSNSKLSKILAGLTPERSTLLSELMAGIKNVPQKSDKVGPMSERKGGEKENGNKQLESSSANTAAEPKSATAGNASNPENVASRNAETGSGTTP